MKGVQLFQCSLLRPMETKELCERLSGRGRFAQ